MIGINQYLVIILAIATIIVVVWLMKSAAIVLWAIATFLASTAIGKFTGILNFGEAGIQKVIIALVGGIIFHYTIGQGNPAKSLVKGIIACVIAFLLTIFIH